MRIKCVVAYDGTDFHGWEKQPRLRTVQGEIEKAINKITSEDNTVYSSGRTDAGVHAHGQVFHFDTQRDISEKKWQQAINHFLPPDIVIKDSRIVSENFHSRYSASAKEYHYLLSSNIYDPFSRQYIYQYPYGSLDLATMREAAELFIGRHDFASYCVYNGLGTTIRTLFSFEIEAREGVYTFKLIGDGFRRYMVRYLVGGVVQAGARRVSPARLDEMLASKGKLKCLYKAPPQGLYLEHVFYDN